MITRRPLFAVLAPLLFVAAITAQGNGQNERGRYAGWVADHNGKRVVGARVTLISRPLPARPDIGETDHLQVMSTPDGMFRARLLHGRSYSAWATWQDDDGTAHRTDIVEGIFPGPPRALPELAAQTVARVRITGTEMWAEHAPLQVLAITNSENIAVVPLELGEDLTAKLPTLPGTHCNIEVRGKTGFVLTMANMKSLTAKDEPELTVAISKPHKLRVTVVDDKQKPLAGVLVRHAFGYHTRNIMTAIGTTDAQGVLDCRIPSHNPMYVPSNQDLCVLEITKAGMQRRLSWTTLGKVGNSLTLTMPPGPDLLGSVRGTGDEPATGLMLLPDCYAMGADNESTGTGVPPRPLALQKDGSFRFSGLHPKYDYRLLGWLRPQDAIAQGLNLRPDIAVAPVMWFYVGAPPFQQPHVMAPIRLDKLQVAQIRVTTSDGIPAPGARLIVTTESLYNSPMKYACDRVGRLQFVLPLGTIRIGAFLPGGGIATTLVTSDGIVNGESQPPLVIELSETRTIEGTIVGPDGEPVAGMTVYQWDRAQTKDRKLAELSYEAHATSNKTGPDGKYSITLPLADAPTPIQAFGKVGDKSYVSGSIQVSPSNPEKGPLRIRVAPFQKKKK